jgi:CheY-like chemotaxis protein
LIEKRGPEDPEQTDLRKILRAARRGADLTHQLLAFSRRMEAQLQPMDLNREVREVTEILKRTIPRMIDLDLQLTPDPVAVEADPGQIEQALLNLGLNARDAMPDGGRLTVRTSHVDEGEFHRPGHPLEGSGPLVLVEVSDTGHGIDPETARHIFDPFFTTKAVGAGTGLGLSMVYGIVQGHRGNVTCESTPGEGTTFRIYLPRFDGPIPDPEPSTADGIPGTVAGGTVLVVDDEDEIRELAQSFLEAQGFRVFTAASGEDAIDVYRNRGESIDAVVLDLGMPGMGGRACLERLQELDPAIRVVIATGYSVDDHAPGVLEAGAVGLINKPYRARELVARLEQVLAK